MGDARGVTMDQVLSILTGVPRWTLTLDMLGRPVLSNAVAKLPGVAQAAKRRPWRDATVVLARAERIPALPAIHVTAQARYRTRRSPSDTDAAAPTVKGVIDGLVVAGVVPDDGPPFVRSVTYLMPLVGTGLPDALIVHVTAAADRDEEAGDR